jgi:EmrB/QacA subfamily drug resistance transporter
VTLLVAVTFFMESLDGTIIATAAPAMGRFFDVQAVQVSVAITAYLLTLAVLIPASGWLTTRVGARPVFAAAIAVFTVASLLCALCTTLPELTAMRVLQGAGGAMMVPVGRLAVLSVTDRRDLVAAFAWLTWPALAAPVIAPLAGGWIATSWSWQVIFLLNLPIGVAAFVAALVLVPRLPRGPRQPLDLPGLLLTGGGIAALTVCGSILAAPRPDGLAAVVTGGIGVALTGAAVVELLRSPAPLFDLRILRIETFRTTHAGGSAFRLTVNGVPFLLPLLFQDALGWTPVQAGAVVLWLFVGNLAIKPMTTPLLRRFGFRPVLLVASLTVAASIGLMAAIGPATPVLLTVLLLVVSGAARSVGFTGYNTIAFADVPSGDMVHANTLASTVQQLAAGLGVSVAAVALRAGGLLGSDGPLVPYRVAFLVLGALTLLASWEAVVLSRDAGARIRPQPRRARAG